MDDKEVFRNNLLLLKEQKISHIITLKRISGLSALCRIFNQSILENGNNLMLSNKHYCVQLSMSDICKQMSKRTQKKYSYYQQGKLKINKDLLRHDIRLLIIAEVIRKVDFKDLTPHVQKNISDKKKDFNDGKITDNPYVSAPYYEVLDLNNCHLERLTKIKNKDISSYPIVQQLFGDQLADNCFNSTMRDYKNGLDSWGEASFKSIIETIQKNKVISIKYLSEYCAHNLSLDNGKYKPQTWWHKQLRGFDFSQYNIVLCKNNKLGKRKQLSIYGGTLVFYYHKKKDAKLGGN
ncbi:hypothetical protein KGF71_016660 [Lactiplantibacillus plantarum]|uniref:hypothetical protein n=1 Tax=Lactiplantibacillus plantarum TaxID=1590 RepID=UPI001C1FC265|nr:hypothetical protein [Lactiplantibacillus plantarum]MBU7446223.1 hypothetical protein [Lactiplantibacillus plantarum]MBU7459371.1 hypothetical protein [Lactiplantibacillus plantarum]